METLRMERHVTKCVYWAYMKGSVYKLSYFKRTVDLLLCYVFYFGVLLHNIKSKVHEQLQVEETEVEYGWAS